MNSQFKIKFLQHLNTKKANKGFTLIELLVVVIIIGVLAAIALPNLLNQVAKGRQAEAKNNLGSMNRAQQAYRLEESVFAPAESDLPVKFSWQYYNLSYEGGTRSSASYNTVAQTQYEDDILDYDAGVVQNATGTFDQIVCEQKVLNTGAANGFAGLNTGTAVASCGSDSKEVKK